VVDHLQLDTVCVVAKDTDLNIPGEKIKILYTKYQKKNHGKEQQHIENVLEHIKPEKDKHTLVGPTEKK